MKGIAFGNFRVKIESLFNEWSTSIHGAKLKEDLQNSALSVCHHARSILESEARLKVSLLGEFSAGKSSLISALTGVDVTIDADVATTELQSFEWNGVALVDTPGVQAEASETAHDTIARASTVDSDLVLFVLTNELFNQRLADYFHFVAGNDGLALADKIAIVVNKMDRETNKDEVILTQVQQAIQPYAEIPIFLAAIRNYLEANRFYGTQKERLIERSRVEDLVQGIDKFIKERGSNGRLTRPLQLFEDSLNSLRESLVKDDDDVKNQLELLRRNKRIIQEGERKLNSMELGWTSELRSIILSNIAKTLNSVVNTNMSEELEQLLEEAFCSFEPDLEQEYVKINNELRLWVQDMEKEFDDLDASSLGEIVHKLGLKQELGEKNVFFNAPSQGFNYAKMTKQVMTEGLGSVLEGAAKNSKTVKELVYKVGKKMGKKFWPWEATKHTKKIVAWAGKGSKVLGPLSIALDFYMEYRAEKVKEEQQRHLAKMRLAMQRQFRSLAETIIKALQEALLLVRESTLQAMIEKIESQTESIISRATEENTFVETISMFIKRSRNIRTDINKISVIDNDNKEEAKP